MRVLVKVTELEETTHHDNETKVTSLVYNVYMRLLYENKAMSQITAMLKTEHIEHGLPGIFESLVGKHVYVNLGQMTSDRGGRIWFFPQMNSFGGPSPKLAEDQPKNLNVPHFDSPGDFPAIPINKASAKENKPLFPNDSKVA